MPGPQTLWFAQDLLPWLAWHALPWLARLALLPELQAQVQQGWPADGRRTQRFVLPLVAKDALAESVGTAGFSRATAAFCPR